MKTKVQTEQISKNDIPEQQLKEIESESYFKSYLTPIENSIEIPEDLKSDLAKTENKFYKLVYKKGMKGTQGPDYIKLVNSDNLHTLDIEFSFGENRSNMGKAINLLEGCTDYCSEGALIYIPDLNIFGNYDIEHEKLTYFPNVTWSDLKENFGAYILTQWYKPKKTSFWADMKSGFEYNKLKKQLKTNQC
jgi:hypothetical protein